DFGSLWNSRKNHSVLPNDLLRFGRSEKFNPFPRLLLVLASDPDRIGETVEHSTAAHRSFWQRCEADFEFAVFPAPTNIPGTYERQSALAPGEEAIGARLPGIARRNNKALFQLHIGDPLNRLGKLWIIIIKVLRPGPIVKL